MRTYPITILWPTGTLPQLAGDAWKMNLETGEVKVTYQDKVELERAVHTLALVAEVKKVGGVVKGIEESLEG